MSINQTEKPKTKLDTAKPLVSGLVDTEGILGTKAHHAWEMVLYSDAGGLHVMTFSVDGKETNVMPLAEQFSPELVGSVRAEWQTVYYLPIMQQMDSLPHSMQNDFRLQKLYEASHDFAGKQSIFTYDELRLLLGN